MRDHGKHFEVIAGQILEQISKQDEPHVGSIANAIGISLQNTKNHLKAPKNLFVIDEIYPDIQHFQASFSKRILTWILLELRSQISYKGTLSDRVHFFKSPLSQPIHFVNVGGKKLSAVKIIFSDSVDSPAKLDERRTAIVLESRLLQRIPCDRLKKPYPVLA